MGLKKLLMVLAAVNQEYRTRAVNEEWKSNNKRSSHAVKYPVVDLFPSIIQKLIAAQINKAERMVRIC